MYKMLLCWRYLHTRYLALVCIVSVMLGVATLIVVNSVMAGFTTKLQERLHGLLSDIDVEAYGANGFDDYEGKMRAIREDEFLGPRVVAMTPVMEVFAMLQYEINGETILKPVHLIGVDPEGRAQMGGFKEHLVHQHDAERPSFQVTGDALQRWNDEEARAEFLSKAMRLPPLEVGNNGKRPPKPPVPTDSAPHGIILGYAIAHARIPEIGPDGKPVLGPDGKPKVQDFCLRHPGDKVVMTTISFISDRQGDEQIRPVNFSCAVVDYVKTELSEYDGNYAYMALEDLQHLRTMQGRATSLQLKIKDFNNLTDVQKKEIKARLLEKFPNTSVSTWEDKQGALLSAIAIERGILNVLLFLIIGVAGFGILAIFSMIVVEKTRDIGIIKSLGASNRGVMSIFLSYGFLLGAVGAVLGTILGLLFTEYINEIEKGLAYVTGQQVFNPTVYYFNRIPTDIQASTVILVNLGSVFIAVLFSVVPALRAALLHPVRALRYE
jgi:lipoprotein-releasing system permease protein